jgi:hypothetical protein
MKCQRSTVSEEKEWRSGGKSKEHFRRAKSKD